MERKDIWVVGGDGRQAALARLLAEDGHRVRAYALEDLLRCEDSTEGMELAAGVILPLPALGADGLLNAPCSRRRVSAGELLDCLRPGQRVLAGRVTPALDAAAAERGLTLLDYFAREELAVGNAVPTAEGAIRIAMEVLPVTVHGARILVLGYGRVGQALGLRLRALGARVDVAARRREQRALAESHGLSGTDLPGMREGLHACDLVVNTVPALLLGAEELAALKQGTPVLDLASLPGGVDDESAAALNVRVIRAPALPGKDAPLTAARLLRDTVYHLLEG